MAIEDLPNPESRKETYLAKAAGMEVEELPTPASREELYLNAIAEGGGGGGGGTSNFNELNNRPSYNGVAMTGNTNIPEVKSYTAGANITIDGATISATDTKYTAGTNVSISEQNVISATDTTYTAGTGLALTGTEFSVDTATIQEKLVAGTNITISGNTISAAGGGSSYTAGEGINISAQNVISATNTGLAKELTTADYNYPANNPTSVALWLLPSGLYFAGSGATVRINTDTTLREGGLALVDTKSAAPTYAYIGALIGNNNRVVFYTTFLTTGTNGPNSPAYNITDKNTIDNLTSTSTSAPLSANQGKVLKDLVDSIAIRASGAPTTSTAGSVGTLYEDTTNGDLYICTDATNPYVWEEVGGGSGPTVVQTIGTSTTDVMSQNAVSKALFNDASTGAQIKIGNNASSTGTQTVAIGAGAKSTGAYSVALGRKATASHNGSVALGEEATTSADGQVTIGSANTNYGYNNSNYRLLTGLYDPQSAHDAATKGYVDTQVGNINTALQTLLNGTGA